MASNTSAWNRFSLFADEVFSSTDLNRRAGEVLDRARNGPVTISRNKEQFALLRREDAAELVKALGNFGPMLELLAAALGVVEGKEPPVSFIWLKAFEIDDLRKMIWDVMVASTSALHETGDWESVNSIIHEWRESGIVAMSGVLDRAMKSPSNETSLPDPRALLEADTLASASRK